MQIKIYYDYKSPSCYLFLDEIYKLEELYNVELIWIPLPLDFAVIYGVPENRTEREINKLKYLYSEARKIAKEKNLVLKPPKKIFNTNFVSISALYIIKKNKEKLKSYNLTVFERFFKRELDLENKEQIIALMEEMQYDKEAFLAYAEKEGNEDLERVCEQAKEDKIFGIPSFVMDNELYWGGIRIPWVCEKLNSLNLKK